MYIVHVHAKVKKEHISAFIEATIENARNSVQEPGVARFDVLQEQENPGHFVLIEVYRTPDDPAKHKETAHYAQWRGTVQEMMLEPRQSVIYSNLFPEDESWG